MLLLGTSRRACLKIARKAPDNTAGGALTDTTDTLISSPVPAWIVIANGCVINGGMRPRNVRSHRGQGIDLWEVKGMQRT